MIYLRKRFFQTFCGQGRPKVENHSSKNWRNLQHQLHPIRKIGKIFQKYLEWAEEKETFWRLKFRKNQGNQRNNLEI